MAPVASRKDARLAYVLDVVVEEAIVDDIVRMVDDILGMAEA